MITHNIHNSNKIQIQKLIKANYGPINDKNLYDKILFAVKLINFEIKSFPTQRFRMYYVLYNVHVHTFRSQRIIFRLLNREKL